VNLLLERAMIQLEGTRPSIDDIETAHRPANDWASGFVNNLRVARKSQAGGEVDGEIADLIKHAEVTAEKLLSDRAATSPDL
jgi:hypothetical protein